MEFVIDLGVLTSATLGLTAVIKQLFKLETETGKRFLPAISIVVGVLLAGTWLTFTSEAILTGIFLGLSASGLWSGSKSAAGK